MQTQQTITLFGTVSNSATSRISKNGRKYTAFGVSIISDCNIRAFHYNVVAFGKQGHFAKPLQTGTRIKLVVQAQSQPDNIATRGRAYCNISQMDMKNSRQPIVPKWMRGKSSPQHTPPNVHARRRSTCCLCCKSELPFAAHIRHIEKDMHMRRYRDAPYTDWKQWHSLYSLDASEAVMMDVMERLFQEERSLSEALLRPFSTRDETKPASTRAISTCELCGQAVFSDRLGDHLTWCGTETNDPLEGYARLPFRMLPPGSRSQMEAFADHFRLPTFHDTNQIAPDWSRIHFVEKFDPIWKAWGETAWHGYAVFTFDFTDIVVLESVHYAHAMYLLRGDWREMVQHSKAEIRHEFRAQHRRLTHRSGYKENFQRLLRNGWT